MYNLLIAISIGAALFGLGMGVAGTIVAGIIPALLGVIIAYILLARRTGRLFQAVMERATKEFQANRFEPGMRMMESCFRFANWQFLIGPQIHGQMGMLYYLQRKWGPARKHLSQSWKRDWRAQSMLAALDHREGKKPAALERLEKLTGWGGKDPVFWGLYAYVALEAKQRDKALELIGQGLKKCPDSPGLKDMANAVRNKKKLKMKAFAPTWYQYFPEQMPRSQMQRYAQNQPGMRYPQPRR
jgi:predicted Zn-dependent protease